MPDTYTVKPGDSLWKISKDNGVSFQELKKANPQLADRIPPYGVNPGDTINLPPKQKKGDVKKTCEDCEDCTVYTLKAPFLIAKAKDSYITTQVNLTVNDDVLKGGVMELGQDITHASGRTAPGGQSVADNEADLKTQMEGLLGVFAAGDSSGMSRRLFDGFLSKKSGIEVFTDGDLDKAVSRHANFTSFADKTLAAPGTPTSKTRIHQALQAAGWDINQVKLIDDLGVPAFNLGSKVFSTGDFNNGLGVMINGVQYVYVFVEAYTYNSCKKAYDITLKFALYDVFGLDDDDLREFGSSGGVFSTAAGRGITAWWQLQHQYNYAPLLTRAVVYKTYHVPTE